MSWSVHKIIRIHPKQYIYGITTDNRHNVYFTSGDDGLWKLNTIDYSLTQLIDNKSFHMRGISYDSKTHTLFICHLGHSILQYNLAKRELSVLTGKPYDIILGCCDGPLNRASFCYPTGITIDKERNLYITESKNCGHNSPLEINFSYLFAFLPADGNALQAKFSSLAGITMNLEGVIYVADGNALRKVDQQMVFTEDGSFQKADGIVSDLDGHIFIIDNCGVYQVRFSPYCKSIIWHDNDLRNIAVDKKGFLYVGSREIIVLQKSWNVERWLWIGKLKEDPSCHLTKLPRDLIREIMCYLKFCDMEAIRATHSDTNISFDCVGNCRSATKARRG